MGTLFALAIFLIIFEGTIIFQCEGKPNTTSSTQESPGTSTSHTVIEYPMHVKFNELLLENPKVVIDPKHFDCRDNWRRDKKNNAIIEFGSFGSLFKFFGSSGGHVTRLAVTYNGIDTLQRNRIREEIFIKCAHKLNELRIHTFGDKEFWDDLSHNGKNISFTNVKKFKYISASPCNENFELNSILPKLESVCTGGMVNVARFLANVETLKALKLIGGELDNEGYISILGRNQMLEKISLFKAKDYEMEVIAKHAKKLKKFKLIFLPLKILFRENNQIAHVFSEVEEFKLSSLQITAAFSSKQLAFDMPKLKKFRLMQNKIDSEVVAFIVKFRAFRNVNLIRIDYAHLESAAVPDLMAAFPKPEWNVSILGSRHFTYLMCKRKVQEATDMEID